MFYLISCFLLYTQLLYAQQVIYVNNNNIDESLPVIQIDDAVAFPDIQVQMGRWVNFPDFQVRITSNEREADIIITADPRVTEIHVRVDNADAFPDLSILVGDERLVRFPDVRIRVVDFRAQADVVIFSEKGTLSEQELIAALLPAIREKAEK